MNNIEEKFWAILHERVGRCSHCGKRKCAGKKSGSILPERIPFKDIQAAIQQLAYDKAAKHESSTMNAWLIPLHSQKPASQVAHWMEQSPDTHRTVRTACGISVTPGFAKRGGAKVKKCGNCKEALR